MHEHDHHHNHPQRLHHDWRLWVVVGLMLLAMFVYIFTQDEAVVPGGNQPAQPPMPAAP